MEKNYEVELTRIKHILLNTKGKWQYKAHDTSENDGDFHYITGVLYGLQIARLLLMK